MTGVGPPGRDKNGGLTVIPPLVPQSLTLASILHMPVLHSTGGPVGFGCAGWAEAQLTIPASATPATNQGDTGFIRWISLFSDSVHCLLSPPVSINIAGAGVSSSVTA